MDKIAFNVCKGLFKISIKDLRKPLWFFLNLVTANFGPEFV